jgi:hypothetical protein
MKRGLNPGNSTRNDSRDQYPTRPNVTRTESFPSMTRYHLTTDIIGFESNGAMPKWRNSQRGREVERERERERDRSCRTSAREAEASPFGSCVVPRCCGRPYVRASRCYDPISIPPSVPLRPLSYSPSPSPDRPNDPSRALLAVPLCLGLSATSPRS